MIEVTPAAAHQVAEFFKGRDVKPIRIFLNSGGWAGAALAMALDKSTESDEVYKINGYEYIVDKQFLEQAKPIKIDFQGQGFKLESSIKIEGGCSGCESSSETDACG